MKTLSCKTLDAASTCEYVATAATTEEVVGMMVEHAKSAHADKMEGADEAAVAASMAAAVTDEAEAAPEVAAPAAEEPQA